MAHRLGHRIGSTRSLTRIGLIASIALVASITATVPAQAAATSPAAAPAAATPPGQPDPRACPPAGLALGFSDALNKATVDGATVGGLSALAYDTRRHAYAALVDRTGTMPARLVFFTRPDAPELVGALPLRTPTGIPYDGTTFDGEGLAVLRDGRYVVSSETEPSIRIFDRSGTEQASLPVPARFRVAPAGEATDNATLEGLALSPSGRYLYAAMEGALSGDAPPTGEARTRRILVYRQNAAGGFDLVRQLGYQVEPGNRISEIAAYADGRLIVLEASFAAGVGNRAALYAVPAADRGADVTTVADLATAPAGLLVGKQLVADLTACPTLGATNPGTQINPLMDNYEALAIEPEPEPGRNPAPSRTTRLDALSDDNFGATQVTRLLRLALRLP